jgi:hypothetical protein
VSAHTPGPWTFHQRCGEVRGRVNGEECVVADVPREAPFEKQTGPNGRLIAAAPDLLAALRGLYDLCPEGHLDDKRGKWADAWAAIAKAEGR